MKRNARGRIISSMAKQWSHLFRIRKIHTVEEGILLDFKVNVLKFIWGF